MALITETEHASVSATADAANAAMATAASHRFSVIEPGAQVGLGTTIGAHVCIAATAVVGEHCVIESGVHVCRGTVIEDEAHVGANVAFATAPRGAAGPSPSPAVVRRGAWIGANSSIGANVVIGAKALVRPGSVVTRSVPPGAIVEGNPATIVGYVDTLQSPAATLQISASQSRARVEAMPVDGVTLHHFPVIPDLRGNLTVGEFDRQIPFLPKRYFMVFGVPSREVRGEHAHHACHQFLICLRGSCAVVADDGTHKVEIALDSPDRGLYLPPMTWGIQYKYSSDAMLLVFASHYYDAADYIRDYAEFIRHIAPEGGGPATVAR